MTANGFEPPPVPIFTHHIFARQRVGGISRYFIELIEELQRTGISPRISAPLYFTDGLKQVHGVVGARVPPVAGTRSGVRLMCEAGELVTLRCWRRQLGGRAVVHRTYHARSEVPSGLAHVETVHDMIHERFPQYFPGRDRISEAKRVACQKADMIIAVSDHTRRMLIEHFDLPSERIRVCYHGVTALPTDERRVAELNNAPPFLLVVGNRGGYKNFLKFLHSFAASGATKSGITLRAFGGGAPTAAEQEQITALRLDKFVEFSTGNDAELSASYASALALVYPGLEEGFGMPPLEAMVHRCPVVASNVGGIPEVVGDAAVLFDPNSVESMTSALDAVLSDEPLRRELSSRGVARAGLFTWEKTVSTTLAAYDAALELAPGRGRT